MQPAASATASPSVPTSSVVDLVSSPTSPITPSSRGADVNSTKSLDELLRCFICFGRVSAPHLCPSCSKMGCYTCISRWLDRQNSCPHCRATLSRQQLVNCRFMEEIHTVIQQLHTQQRNNTDTTHTQYTQQQQQQHQQANRQHRTSAHSYLSTPSSPSSSSSVPKGQQCAGHPGTALSYYCLTCSTALCSDCVVFSSAHTHHSIDRLHTVYEQHVLTIRHSLTSLQTRQTQLLSLTSHLDTSMRSVRHARNAQLDALTHEMEIIKQRIQERYKQHATSAVERRNRIATQMAVVDGWIEMIQQHLDPRLCSEHELILKTEELVTMIQEIQHNPVADICHVDINTNDFKRESLLPPFVAQQCILPYPYHGNSNSGSSSSSNVEVVYSSPLHYYGLVWRLKVYPEGNGEAKGSCLSVFIELSNGVGEEEQVEDPAADPSSRGEEEADTEESKERKYEYRIELLHVSDSSRTIVRTFCSHFSVGECWGYTRFFRLDLLASEGYVVMPGQIHLQFSIRCPSYYALHQRQERRYKAQTKKLKEKEELIRVLKQERGGSNNQTIDHRYRQQPQPQDQQQQRQQPAEQEQQPEQQQPGFANQPPASLTTQEREVKEDQPNNNSIATGRAWLEVSSSPLPSHRHGLIDEEVRAALHREEVDVYAHYQASPSTDADDASVSVLYSGTPFISLDELSDGEVGNLGQNTWATTHTVNQQQQQQQHMLQQHQQQPIDLTQEDQSEADAAGSGDANAYAEADEGDNSDADDALPIDDDIDSYIPPLQHATIGDALSGWNDL